MKLHLIAVSAVLSCATICLAQSTSAAPSAVAGTVADAPSAEAASASVAAVPAEKPTVKPDERTKLYVLGPLDELSIQVWANPTLTRIYAIGPDGFLNMPLIGPTKADGLTVPELTDVITSKLTKLIKTPDVNIEILRTNSKKFYVMGEGAARSGEFPLTGPTTVSQGLAIAGGTREFANVKKIYVLRGPKKFYFNYKDVMQGKHLEQDIQLENGDKIVIPQ